MVDNMIELMIRVGLFNVWRFERANSLTSHAACLLHLIRAYSEQEDRVMGS